MRRLLSALFCAALVAICLPQRAPAQDYTRGTSVSGVAVNRSTVKTPVTITTGGTFQTILPSIIGNSVAVRQSLTIQNNNATSTCLAAGNCQVCYVFIGTGTPTTGTSITLVASQGYTRFFPFVPSDLIQATCDNSGATLYVDTQ